MGRTKDNQAHQLPDFGYPEWCDSFIGICSPQEGIKWIYHDTRSQGKSKSHGKEKKQEERQTCRGWMRHVLYLPTKGFIFGEVFCSQDVSMDHVLNEGEVHQVLPIPAGAQEMVQSMLRAPVHRAKNLGIWETMPCMKVSICFGNASPWHTWIPTTAKNVQQLQLLGHSGVVEYLRINQWIWNLGALPTSFECGQHWCCLLQLQSG